MVLRLLGAAALAELMRNDRPEPVMDWLLFGPEDDEVVETPAPQALLMAAE